MGSLPRAFVLDIGPRRSSTLPPLAGQSSSGRRTRERQLSFDPGMGTYRMQEPIFDAIPVTYRGLFADQHLVDAQQFGKSLIGVTKLANSICHEIFHEEIT